MVYQNFYGFIILLGNLILILVGIANGVIRTLHGVIIDFKKLLEVLTDL